MAKDITKVYLNIGGRTLKNIRSIEFSKENTKTLDDKDIYGKRELIVSPDDSLTITTTVRKNTDDDVFLFDLDMANAEVPITYRDAAGKREIVAAGARASVSFQPRTNDTTNNDAAYEIVVTGVASLGIV